MKLRRIKDIDWLKFHIGRIEQKNSRFKDELNILKDIDKGTYNEFQYWTPLKLIVLNYLLDICTKISRKYFKNICYIDLFAGSGIDHFKNKKDDFLMGSPLISVLNYGHIYDKMIFCENDSESFKALDLRLKFLKRTNIDVIPGCCNKTLTKIITGIGKKDWAFIFVDPYCLEFDWNSMKTLLGLRSDILFTFMSKLMFDRVVSAEKTKESNRGLDRFFGDNSWESANSPEDLVEIYKRNIIKERPWAVIEVIKIQSTKRNFYYHLFFITNQTKGEMKWLKPIKELKEKIENYSDEAVKISLDMITRGQTELASWEKI